MSPFKTHRDILKKKPTSNFNTMLDFQPFQPFQSIKTVPSINVPITSILNAKPAITKQEIQDINAFKKDNVIASHNEKLIIPSYIYFKFLTRLYHTTQQVPFYCYKDNELARYYSPEPPRVFEGLYFDLQTDWDNRYKELNGCFLIPSGEVFSSYEVFREVSCYHTTRLVSEYFSISEPYEDRVYFSHENLFKGFGEIWYREGDLIYPISLLLNLLEHSNYYRCRTEYSMPYRFWHYVYKELSFFLPSLEII